MCGMLGSLDIVTIQSQFSLDRQLLWTQAAQWAETQDAPCKCKGECGVCAQVKEAGNLDSRASLYLSNYVWGKSEKEASFCSASHFFQ